jgi:hypothetical protein
LGVMPFWRVAWWSSASTSRAELRRSWLREVSGYISRPSKILVIHKEI